MDNSVAPRIAPRTVDLAVAALILVVVLVGTAQVEPDAAGRSADWLAFLSGAAASVSFVWWRRQPIVVAGVVSVAIGVYLGRRYAPGPMILTGPLAIAALGYVVPRRIAWAGVAVMMGASAIGLVASDQADLAHLLAFPGWGVAAVLAGQAFAARGERAVAERERVAVAQEQALATERLRIAQDLHDSVAHAMATINVQSGVAAHLVEQQPEQAAVALEAIRVASRDALEELGAILGVLREPGSSAPLAPLAGLDNITDLVERARDDGVTVALDQTGDVDAIPPTVGTAAYRAVQEALTNTRRHAGDGANVTVTVAVNKHGSLHLAVADDGGQQTGADHRTDLSSAGFGLDGMRERVESSGGTLRVGPASPAGFLVEAAWPERARQ